MKDSTPRKSRKEKKPNPSPKKRGVRWFVIPPSFSWSNRQASSGSGAVKEPVSKSPRKRSRFGRSLRPEVSEWPESPPVSATLVHQLRLELEEAREQIKALERIKELQAQERRNWNQGANKKSTEPMPSTLLPNSPCRNSQDSDEKGAEANATVSHQVVQEAVDSSQPNTSPALKEPKEKSHEGDDVDLLSNRVAQNDPYWQTTAFENAGSLGDDDSFLLGSNPRHGRPPVEIMAIREPEMTGSRRDWKVQWEESNQRAQAYRSKLEASQDLVASLFRDMERARRSIHSLVRRNIALRSNRKELKMEQEENMVHRSTLAKACVYIAPVFVFCGGFESFLSTVLLVWILIEVGAGIAMDDSSEDDEDQAPEQDEEDNEMLSNAPVPNSIVVPTDKGEN